MATLAGAQRCQMESACAGDLAMPVPMPPTTQVFGSRTAATEKRTLGRAWKLGTPLARTPTEPKDPSITMLFMLRVVPVVLASVALASGQSLTWAEGSSTAALNVQTVAESQPGGTPATILANVEFLSIEMTGRTLQQELDSTRSRRITNRGLTRVELPSGGRVLAYRRNAGQAFGYLLVRRNGVASVLLELPGVATQTPFADRIGVSPDGRWGVACSASESTLYFLRLDGTTFASTGTPSRVLNLPSLVELTTIMPGRSHVFFAGDDERMRRCAMVDGGLIEDISPPSITGARLKSELAMSGDGRRVVFLYGVQPAFSLWMASETGAPTRINAPVAKYEEPGYLPETPAGPRLMLNFDGSRLMCVDATLRDEIYVHDTTGATATTHVTGDHNFQPYIGIGIFPTFAAALLVVGVGDVDRFDMFAAATGDVPVVNLTRTNGNVVRPFGAGGLVPLSVSMTLGTGLLITEQPAGAARRLLRVDLATGQSALVADQLTRLPALGDATAGLPDILVASPLGDQALEGLSATTLLAAPAGVDITSDVLLPAARVLSVRAGGVSAIVFRLGDGTFMALPAVLGDQRASVTVANNLVVDGASLLHVSPALGAVTVSTSGSVRLVLSGFGR